MLGSGLNIASKTYNEESIAWYNLPYFSQEFLKIVGFLHKFDIEMIENGQKLSDESKEQKLEYIDELKKIYKIIMGIRLTIRSNYENDKGFKKCFDDAAQKDSIFWMNSICYTYDPRLVAYGIPGILPMVLYPSQEGLVKEVELCFENNQKLYVDKSRAEGASEIMCAWAVWLWKYRTGAQIAFISRVLTAVDNSDDPDALFSRLKRFIFSMPSKMLPKGFKRNRRSKYIKYMRIMNPDNGATLTGGGGKDPKRSGRASIVIVDEFASLDDIAGALSSLGEVSRCHIYITTPKGQNGAYDLRNSGNVQLYSLWWYCNPSKNPYGYKKNVRPKDNDTYWRKWKDLTDDEFAIRQEVEIDYNAYVDGVMIPREWITAAINFPSFNKTSLDISGGLDLSAGGKDKPALALRKGIRLKEIVDISKTITPLQQARIGVKECENIDAVQLAYDKNGLGHDVVELRPFTNVQLEGIMSQGKAPEIPIEGAEGDKGDIVFKNYRAYLWWNLRVRFKKTFQHVNNIKRYPENELISIPSHAELIKELSTPTMIFNGGKIQVESKDSMRSRNIKSPNYADAVSYAFAPIRGNRLIKINSMEKIGIDEVKKIIGYHFASWHYSDNGDMHCVYTGLDYNKSQLITLKEFYFEAGTDPKEMLQDIYFHLNPYSRIEHIVNLKFYDDCDSMHSTQKWIYYKKQGIKFKQNHRYNPELNFKSLNKLADKNMLKVDKINCETLYGQCVTCKKEDFLNEDKSFFAIALLNIISYILHKSDTKMFFSKLDDE